MERLHCQLDLYGGSRCLDEADDWWGRADWGRRHGGSGDCQGFRLRSPFPDRAPSRAALGLLPLCMIGLIIRVPRLWPRCYWKLDLPRESSRDSCQVFIDDLMLSIQVWLSYLGISGWVSRERLLRSRLKLFVKVSLWDDRSVGSGRHVLIRTTTLL